MAHAPHRDALQRAHRRQRGGVRRLGIRLGLGGAFAAARGPFEGREVVRAHHGSGGCRHVFPQPPPTVVVVVVVVPFGAVCDLAFRAAAVVARGRHVPAVQARERLTAVEA